MTITFNDLINKKKNFILIGETGSGKSEIALNLAVKLAEKKDKAVHLFDMDQTKPLFRSRDLQKVMYEVGVEVHYKSQLLDSPTLVGGVSECLTDKGSYAILDIGGNESAARMIGGFTQLLNNEDTANIYIVNSFRPWSKDALSIDCTMSSILQACRIKKVHLLGNANLGYTTTVEEFFEGCEEIKKMLGEYLDLSGMCIRDDLYEEAKKHTNLYLFPLHLFLKYPWIND
ncbi:MAG: hypothetical protein AB7V48_00290 [Sedimentibacter sp.]